MATRPRKFTEFGTGENVDVRERENSLRPLLGESECESGRGVLLRWDERMGVTVDGRVLFFGEILLFFKIIHVARTTFRQGTLDPRQSKNDTRRVVVESSSFVPSAREDSIATPGKGKFFQDDAPRLLPRSFLPRTAVQISCDVHGRVRFQLTINRGGSRKRGRHRESEMERMCEYVAEQMG